MFFTSPCIIQTQPILRFWRAGSMNLPTVPAVRTARVVSDAHKRQYPRNTLAAGLVPSSVPPATPFDILVVLQCTPELTSALDTYIADIDGSDLWVPESHCFAQAVLHELRKYAPHIPACRAALHMHLGRVCTR
jgi:hypothetical protein